MLLSQLSRSVVMIFLLGDWPTFAASLRALSFFSSFVFYFSSEKRKQGKLICEKYGDRGTGVVHSGLFFPLAAGNWCCASLLRIPRMRYLPHSLASSLWHEVRPWVGDKLCFSDFAQNGPLLHLDERPICEVQYIGCTLPIIQCSSPH